MTASGVFEVTAEWCDTADMVGMTGLSACNLLSSQQHLSVLLAQPA